MIHLWGNHHTSPRGPENISLVSARLVRVTLWLVLGCTPLFAHESAGRIAQQNYRLRVDSRNINLSIDTTFLAHHHTLEEFLEHIHPNLSSGQVGEAEMIELLAGEVTRRLDLRIDGRQLPLYRLYQPQLEFREGTFPRVPASLTLTLFARTPEEVGPGAVFQLRNPLDWQGVESSFQIEGLDGFQFEVRGSSHIPGPAAAQIEFEASCASRPDASIAAPRRAPAPVSAYSSFEALFAALVVAWVMLGLGLLALYGGTRRQSREKQGS